MKFLAGSLILVWILCSISWVKAQKHCPFGKRIITKSRVKRVVGGSEAEPNSWPWIVSFIDDKNLQQCAGSIIDREWILTAAHCFLFTGKPGPLYNNYTFHLADHNLNFTDPQEYDVQASKVYIHPKYVIGGDVSPGDYDIALMKLSRPLNYTNYVQPICVGTKEDISFNENDTCVLTGWGNVKDDTGYHRSPVLKEARLDLVSLEECNSNTSYKGKVSNRFLCAGRRQGGIDGCYGDSGGPYQCERNGTWIQLGIMIWRIGCAQPNHYGVYTDVRVLQPFIEVIQAGPNSNLTSYYMKTLGEVRPDRTERLLSNLYDLLTKESEFSDIDLVRNLELLPYQIQLINKTTLKDLKFVSSKEVSTANTTTLASISDDLVEQVKRLYVYYKSKEVVNEFNITFEAIYKSANLTKDEFLNSRFSVIEDIRKRMYIKIHVNDIRMYRDTLLTYKPGLNVMFNISQIESELDKNADDLKQLEKKALKQILVKHNQELFTKMLSIRNISSFFEISLERLKSMTIGNVLNEHLNINLTTFASLHNLTNREVDIVKMTKISTVPFPDDQSLYGLVVKMLEARVMKCSESSCSKNGNCYQSSDYSFECRCNKGYIGNGFNCDTGNTIFRSELVLNQTFTESLNNPNSAEYKSLSENIENVLTMVIRKERSFRDFGCCQVTGFRNGSVIVQYVLIFQLQGSETVNVSKLTQVVNMATRNGSLAIPVISTKPIHATDLCSLGFHKCHKHATCSVVDNILICTCKENYYRDGVSCIDPCQQHECPANSYCHRGLDGKATCICDPGYTQEGGDCEKANEDFKTAFIIVCCIAGTLLLLALMVCWYQYCNRNRKKSLEISSTKGADNTGYDTMNMDSL